MMNKVKPKKFLGQHFLTDLSIAQRIADTVDVRADLPVLEVGPGMGVMTQFLAKKEWPATVADGLWSTTVADGLWSATVADGSAVGHKQEPSTINCQLSTVNCPKLKVVEIDFESVEYLRKNYPALEDNIIEDDFLKMHLEHTFGGRQFVLTGNYPYNISSQIFFKVLDYRDLIPVCTGMIQKEVAERMAARPGSKTYGILSVLIQAYYDVEYLFTVPPGVFNPPPKVQSAVIRMTRNNVDHLDCDEELFRRLVKTVFNQRRKMLRGSIKPLLATLPGDFTAMLQEPFFMKRPEQLSVQDFIDLTNRITPPQPSPTGEGA